METAEIVCYAVMGTTFTIGLMVYLYRVIFFTEEEEEYVPVPTDVTTQN